MSNTTLQKITSRAKQIRNKRPGMKYTNAVKEAARQLKKEGKIGAVKKVVKRKVAKHKSPVVKKAYKPRRKVAIKKRVSGPVKVRKRIGGSPVKVLEDKLGKEYVKYWNATTIRETDKTRKQIAEIKRAIKKIKNSK